MPYQWTHPTDHQQQRLELWPFRSLPRRGFALFIMTTFGLICLPLLAVLGTVALWGLLPFMLLALAGIWFALQQSYRDAEVLEVLTIDPERVHLTHQTRRGPPREWEASTHWARAEIHRAGGPVPWYVTLTGNGRTVELGAFLSEDERRALYGELADILRQCRQAAPAD